MEIPCVEAPAKKSTREQLGNERTDRFLVVRFFESFALSNGTYSGFTCLKHLVTYYRSRFSSRITRNQWLYYTFSVNKTIFWMTYRTIWYDWVRCERQPRCAVYREIPIYVTDCVSLERSIPFRCRNQNPQRTLTSLFWYEFRHNHPKRKEIFQLFFTGVLLMQIAFQNYLNRIEILRKPVENHWIQRCYGWLHLGDRIKIFTSVSSHTGRAVRFMNVQSQQTPLQWISWISKFSSNTGSDKLRRFCWSAGKW